MIGHPNVVRGTGHTQEHAVLDAILRTKEMIKDLESGLAHLQEAYKQDFDHEEHIFHDKRKSS